MEKRETRWYDKLQYLVEQYTRASYTYKKNGTNDRTLSNRCERSYKKIYDFVKSQRQVKEQELDKAREEVLLELLEKKTNYKIERVDHGYKVTQEYVLVSDIEKELSKLTTK